jgi:hypothetical protein
MMHYYSWKHTLLTSTGLVSSDITSYDQARTSPVSEGVVQTADNFFFVAPLLPDSKDLTSFKLRMYL